MKTLFLVLALSGSLLSQTHKFCATDSTCTWTGTQTFNSVGGLSVSTTGDFTNTVMSLPAVSLLNGCSIQTQFQLDQGNTKFSQDALAGCSIVPNTSTKYQINGVSGYVDNSSASTNAVGGYFSTICRGNNTFCWGTNPHAGTLGSPDSATLSAIEADCDVGAGSTNTVVNCIKSQAVWNATGVSVSGS